MTQLTVYKLDKHGKEVWSYPARELRRDDHHVRLEAFFNRDDIDLGFAILARGDRFVEYFYSDRWYNVFVVHKGHSEELKGWYCNVCRPAVLGEKEIRCQDMALDLWVAPGAETLVLDEDEFAALEITAADRACSLQALEELLRLAKDGRLPR